MKIDKSKIKFIASKDESSYYIGYFEYCNIKSEHFLICGGTKSLIISDGTYMFHRNAFIKLLEKLKKRKND